MAELVPAAAERYCDALRNALAALRLNLFFPPWKSIDAHLAGVGCLPPGEGLRLDPATGWPHGDEWLRVRVDHGLAPGLLASLARLEEAGDALVARKTAYLRAMASASPLGAGELRARLVEARAPGPEWNRFEVVLDRLDLAGPRFVRWTLRLAERGRTQLAPGDLQARASEAFAARLAALTGQQAPAALALLDADPDITVEELVRGEVGPALPGAHGPRLGAVTSRAGRALARTSIDDPLASDLLVPEPAAGFGLSHHRKWAVAEEDAQEHRAWLRARGSRNIVYTYR